MKELYFIARTGENIKPSYSKYYKNETYIIYKKKGICLCIIGKNENMYAKEYVDYYKLLGIDKIVLFDNNDINGEIFNIVLKDYISSNFVEIIDVRGLSSIQIAVYNYCYHKFKYNYDWIAFFDFDEFLYIKNNLKINNFLYDLRFEKCQSILFNWYIYDDNNLEKYEKRRVVDRFNHIKFRLKKIKSIIRGGLEKIYITSAHISSININYFCNSNGNRIFPNSFIEINDNREKMAYINCLRNQNF